MVLFDSLALARIGEALPRQAKSTTKTAGLHWREITHFELIVLAPCRAMGAQCACANGEQVALIMAFSSHPPGSAKAGQTPGCKKYG